MQYFRNFYTQLKRSHTNKPQHTQKRVTWMPELQVATIQSIST